MDDSSRPFSRLVFVYGFTLVELLLVLSVAAILVTIATPSFSAMLARNKLLTQQNDLMSDIMLARSESTKRSRYVSICTANSFATACSDSKNNWHQGWLIYVNWDGRGVYDSHYDELLRIHDPLPSNISLTYNNNLLTFGSRGFLASGSYGGSFKLCNTDSDIVQTRKIIIYRSGRPRRSRGELTNCAS